VACNFVEHENIMPGWGCCSCRTYNGLQRTHCRECNHARCELVTPDDLKVCKNCGFGYRLEMRESLRRICPVCGSYLYEGAGVP